MVVEQSALNVVDRNELVLEELVAQVVADGGPDPPLGGLVGHVGLAPNAERRVHLVGRRSAVATEQHERRRAVTRNVRARGVDDVGQVAVRDDFLDQILPEAPLHEVVADDHPHPSRKSFDILRLGNQTLLSELRLVTEQRASCEVEEALVNGTH